MVNPFFVSILLLRSPFFLMQFPDFIIIIYKYK